MVFDLATIIAIIIAVPVFALPVVLIWYFNVGGVGAAMKDARKAKAQKKAAVKAG